MYILTVFPSCLLSYTCSTKNTVMVEESYSLYQNQGTKFIIRSRFYPPISFPFLCCYIQVMDTHSIFSSLCLVFFDRSLSDARVIHSEEKPCWCLFIETVECLCSEEMATCCTPSPHFYSCLPTGCGMCYDMCYMCVVYMSTHACVILSKCSPIIM